MADFDRYDICVAHAALEYDWNQGGQLRERISNRRRRESTGVQLSRMRFRPAGDEAAGFAEILKSDSADNRAEIYLNALHRMGLTDQVSPSEDIAAYVKKNFDATWVAERFPQFSDFSHVSKLAP